MLKVKYIVDNKTWVVTCSMTLDNDREIKLKKELKEKLQLRDNERLVILYHADII